MGDPILDVLEIFLENMLILETSATFDRKFRNDMYLQTLFLKSIPHLGSLPLSPFGCMYPVPPSGMTSFMDEPPSIRRILMQNLDG